MKDLKQNYLIYSDQKFLTDEAISRLKKKVSSQELGNLNIVEVSSPSEFDVFEQALNTVGFFKQKKVVILHKAEKLIKSQIDAISGYLDSSNPDVTLVMVASKENKSLFDDARKRKIFYEYKSPKKGQLASWVVDYFKIEKKIVNFEAATYLVSLLGDELALLANEIKKISLYVGEKEKVLIEDIGAICSNQAHETIFDLVDAVGRSDTSKALWHLEHLLTFEKEARIFHMIVRQFRLLLKTKGLMTQDKSLNEIARELKLPSFICSKYQMQAKHFSTSDLVHAYETLLETELKMKTSAGALNRALELAIVKILAA